MASVYGAPVIDMHIPVSRHAVGSLERQESVERLQIMIRMNVGIGDFMCAGCLQRKIREEPPLLFGIILRIEPALMETAEDFRVDDDPFFTGCGSRKWWYDDSRSSSTT
jgi:hypothetical protein